MMDGYLCCALFAAIQVSSGKKLGLFLPISWGKIIFTLHTVLLNVLAHTGMSL